MEFKHNRLFFFITWGAIEWFFLYGAILLVSVSQGDSRSSFLALILALAAILLLILGLVVWRDLSKHILGRRWEVLLTPTRIRLGLGLFLTLETGCLGFILAKAAHISQMTAHPFWTRQVAAEIALPSGSILILAAGLVLSLRLKR